MNDQNMKVLANVIGAVESGGQIYGKRDYAAYAAPYTNSNAEHTITLGWAQNYGSEAKKLIQMIHDADPAGFRKIDSSGSIQSMLSKDWVAIKWKPTAAQKKILISLITSDAGKKCQDDLFAELMNFSISECEKNYSKDVQVIMMYCEIRHLGGSGPVKRIFDRIPGTITLDKIMASLVKDQKDTSSSNQVGDSKFWTRHMKCKEFIEQYAVSEMEEVKEVGVHYISNCSGDERGKIKGGAAGDQTGKEWCLRSWYNRPWKCILRHPDPAVRDKIAELAEKAAKNDKVGYDQNQRTTYWKELQKAGYDPAKISTPCEADCSKGVIDNVRATGYLLDIDALKNIDASYTGNMRAGFRAAGFKVLTAKKYLEGPEYLLRGDILLNDGAHTATNISVGVKAVTEKTETAAPAALPVGKSASVFTVSGTSTPSKSEAGRGKVTAAALNVRAWAGKNYVNIKKCPVIKKGATVSVCDAILDNKKDTWYYVKVAGQYYGFVSAKYITKV